MAFPKLSHLVAARTFRTELAPHWGRMAAFQWGKVNNLHVGPPPTVDVFLDGSTTLTTGLNYLATYAPVIGDRVVVGRMQGPAQTARFVIGPIAPVANIRVPKVIDEAVITGPVASVTFPYSVPTIPQTYKHLKVLSYCRSDAAAGATDLNCLLNADTGANYDLMESWFVGGQAAVNVLYQGGNSLGKIGVCAGANNPAGFFAESEATFANYSQATNYKEWIAFGGLASSTAANSLQARYDNTWVGVAITSIKISPPSGNIVAGSVFTLLGI